MLPFIAGLAAGAAVVVAVNNRKEIKEGVETGAKKAKEYAQTGYEKAKDVASDVKTSVASKVECLKSSKKEDEAEEQTEQLENKESTNG